MPLSKNINITNSRKRVSNLGFHWKCSRRLQKLRKNCENVQNNIKPDAIAFIEKLINKCSSKIEKSGE